MIFVLKNLSTFIPLFESSNFISSPQKLLTFSFRPTEIKHFSASSVFPPLIVTLIKSLLSLIPVTSFFVKIFTHCLVSSIFNLREISLSSVNKILSNNSTIVTFTPNEFKMEANSHPITPPPTIINDFGNSSISSNSSLVIILSDLCPKNWGIKDSEPVAIIILSHSIISLFTFILFSEIISPEPLNILILFFCKRNSTPLTNLSTISDFLFRISDHSNLRVSQYIPNVWHFFISLKTDALFA